MWFSTFVIKNITRRPLRGLLTVMAIAMAIGSVEAFFGIAAGFERSFLILYSQAKVDLIVARGGGQNVLGNTLPEELGNRIRSIDGVKDVLTGLEDNISVGSMSAVKLFGLVPETVEFTHKKIQEGRTLRREDKGAIIIGIILAKNLDKNVGEIVEVAETTQFRIVGVYQSNNVIENGALVMPLREAQELLGKKGEVTAFSIVLDKVIDGKLAKEVGPKIEAMAKNITALPTREHIRNNLPLRLAKAMAWLTSAIALLIGFFGMTNTMVMSVNERTREIGTLRAVGWRVGRVIRMVLLESVFLSTAGALVGTLGAILIVGFLTHLPAVNGRIDGTIEPVLMAIGFLIAIAVGLLGSLVPATRAARMLPTEALRYE